MKLKLLLLFVLLSFKSYSQIVFEKGYFIDNNDKKTICLIKNVDWSNNPSEIQYKLDEQDQPISISIQQIKVFEIENQSKYERFTVDVDKSSQAIRDMGYDKNPQFQKETLLLKVLLEGKASFYEYNSSSKIFYFFKSDSLPITQLIFKSYKNAEDQIVQNQQYKQQLWMSLKCENTTIADIEKLSYKKNSLMNYIIKYNQCNNSESKNYKPSVKRDLFNLTLRPGITSSSLSVSNTEVSLPDYNRDFDNKIGFRFGVEAEFLLPVNKNKWAAIIEPTYISYKAEKSRLDSRTNEELKGNVDYKAIEVPLGIRYYMFLNNNSSIFINAQAVLEYSLNSEAYLEYSSQRNITLEPKAKGSFAFGAGYKFKQKYSIEFRANPNKNILQEYKDWNSSYKSYSIIFGYTIL